jgi:hypothetical protein
MSELSELFDRDPLLLSEQDIGVIVARLRENQAQHELGVKPVPVAKPRKPTKVHDLLKDLGLTSSGDVLKDLGLK